ncbi:MAG: glycosyltransferase, partial [Alphaproteobacteria bacterium]|nr:glycosyltransferase [Alphaproteobacteria bacterium]
MARFLAETHGFDVLYREDRDPETKRTKLFFLTETLRDLIFLVKRRQAVRHYDHILALWHSGLAFMLLKRLGVIDYDKLLWFGFSVHSQFWARIYRQIAKLDRDNTWFVVFTEQEIEEYSTGFGIDPSRLLFIAHGDWPQPIDVPNSFGPDPGLDLETPFYFAGGFTNRDYRPVIETFRKLGLRLIIVCSQTNEDVVDEELPGNVQVYRDIPFPDFEMLLKAAKAVIIPLKRDAGAAGHSVLVRSMRNSKLVIANDFRIIHDYIDDRVDGVLLKDMAGDLAPLIQEIETKPEQFAPIRKAAFKRFEREYSQEALEQTMSDLIQGQWIEARQAGA